MGYKVYIPKVVIDNEFSLSSRNFEEWIRLKKQATKLHLDKVKDADIVLVVNEAKRRVKAYIGPSTFSEIAYANALNLSHGKKIKIYLTNKLVKEGPFYAELQAWGVKKWPF